MGNIDDGAVWFMVKFVAGIFGAIALVIVAVLVAASFLIGKAC